MSSFGIKGTLLIVEKVSAKCSNCQSRNTILLTIFTKYAYLFWIPFFPVSKVGITECFHCHEVKDRLEFSKKVLAQSEKLKKVYKTPIWVYSGVIVLSSIILGALFLIIQYHRSIQSFESESTTDEIRINPRSSRSMLY